MSDAIITALLRQNNITTSFCRNNYIIITPWPPMGLYFEETYVFVFYAIAWHWNVEVCYRRELGTIFDSLIFANRLSNLVPTSRRYGCWLIVAYRRHMVIIVEVMACRLLVFIMFTNVLAPDGTKSSASTALIEKLDILSSKFLQLSRIPYHLYGWGVVI